MRSKDRTMMRTAPQPKASGDELWFLMAPCILITIIFYYSFASGF